LAFGRYKGASYFIDRVYEALPQTVLGRIMSPAAVGIYNRADAVCGIPAHIVLGATFSIAFPAFSKQIRAGSNAISSVKNSYLMALRLITGLFWPGTLLLSVFASPVVLLVLGPDWRAAIPILRILALASAFWFSVSFSYPVLIAAGANRDAFVSNFISRALGALILCSASVFGLMAVALSQFISLPLEMVILLTYVRRHIPFQWRELAVALLPSAAVTAATLVGPLVVIVLRGHGFDISIGEMFLLLPLAGAGWLAGIVLARHPLLAEVLLVASSVLRRLPLRPARALASTVAPRHAADDPTNR
ncbi:MAG TPA: oligosaccharide flippase family protein, partial [Pararhizobium sp.]|nr:oligosaccharide flippase family protein [Pararhizobium sp.]